MSFIVGFIGDKKEFAIWIASLNSCILEAMTTLDEIRERIRQHSNLLEERYGVAVVGIFGSYVRGEEKLI